MKHFDFKKSLIWLFFAVLVQSASAQQYLFVDNFNGNYQYPPDNQGWVPTNNSTSADFDWYLGDPTTFAALTGADSSYVAANYNSTDDSIGTISNWLLTPVLQLANGNVFTFYTRTAAHQYADRMQVYLSTAGSGTNVGSSSTSVGTFSVLLQDINPNLSATGYPLTWTAYTATLSGITGTNVTGRFGFRYYVTNAGFGGTNSDYIGVDSVTYYAPATVPTGIKTIKNNEQVALYPNPFKNELTIKGTDGSINVYDILGKQVLSVDFENGQPVNTTSLEKGIYIVRITNNKNELVRMQKINKD